MFYQFPQIAYALEKKYYSYHRQVDVELITEAC